LRLISQYGCGLPDDNKSGHVEQTPPKAEGGPSLFAFMTLNHNSSNEPEQAPSIPDLALSPKIMTSFKEVGHNT
jgi:hypothetical protein